MKFEDLLARPARVRGAPPTEEEVRLAGEMANWGLQVSTIVTNLKITNHEVAEWYAIYETSPEHPHFAVIERFIEAIKVGQSNVITEAFGHVVAQMRDTRLSDGARFRAATFLIHNTHGIKTKLEIDRAKKSALQLDNVSHLSTYQLLKLAEGAALDVSLDDEQEGDVVEDEEG